MRTVTYGGAVSLDGYLAGLDGSIDWLHFSTDVQSVMKEFWKDVDAVLMGRKTYEASLANEPGPTGAWKTYVFSRTLGAIGLPGVELVNRDAAGFVHDLKRQPGKRICLMGGGELAQALLAAGLVDEVGLNVHPVLLGAGIPVFRDPGQRIRLTLAECRQIEGGCVLLNYKVSPPR